MVVRHLASEVKGMKITIVFWSTGKLVNHETVDLQSSCESELYAK